MMVTALTLSSRQNGGQFMGTEKVIVCFFKKKKSQNSHLSLSQNWAVRLQGPEATSLRTEAPLPSSGLPEGAPGPEPWAVYVTAAQQCTTYFPSLPYFTWPAPAREKTWAGDSEPQIKNVSGPSQFHSWERLPPPPHLLPSKGPEPPRIQFKIQTCFYMTAIVFRHFQ